MEWKEVDIEQTSIEIIDGDRGKNYPKNNELTNSGYCLFLSAANVTKNGLQFSNNSFITKEKDALLRKGKLMPQDIVLTTRGTVGNVGFYSDDVPYPNMRINSGMVIIRPGEDFDTMFLYQYLRSCYFRAQITQFQSGSAQPQLPISTLQKMKVIKPDIAAQRRIASILSSFDRKIELNNKINADLEEMAQAIFKNWFVDFEPFKDGKFVDSELGMIPEGWRVGTIGDIVEFQNGFTFSSKDFSENGEYKIITIKSVQDGYLVTDGSSKVTEYPTKMPAYCKLQSGDILLSLTGNVGRCCLVTEPNLLLNQRVAKIKAKECYDNSFSYALFRLKETKELLISISRGTAQANLSPVEASKLPMVIPSEDARKNFSMISGSIMDKITSIHIENRTLSTLRDTLLPRLMSGELEVPE